MAAPSNTVAQRRVVRYPCGNGSTLHARTGSASSAVATNAGTDAEQLVKKAVLRLLEDEVGLRANVPQSNGELPLWHLGGVGPLHRRDIYDDAR